MLVKSEPSCDQTEFLHSNGTCVTCPVCGPGEQLSEVTYRAHYSGSTFSFLFLPFSCLAFTSLVTCLQFILYIILRTVVLEMVVKVCVFCVKKGRSVQIQV